MKMQQSGIFARRAKNLHADEKKALDKAVKAVLAKPSLGQMKVGLGRCPGLQIQA